MEGQTKNLDYNSGSIKFSLYCLNFFQKSSCITQRLLSHINTHPHQIITRHYNRHYLIKKNSKINLLIEKNMYIRENLY